MNSPTSGGTGCGTYIDFNGTSQYIYTNTDLSPLFSGVSPNKSEVTSIFMWIYPQGDGVIVSEVGVSNSLLGWHTSILEMVSGTLKFGLWNGTANSVVTSSISTPLNNWYYVGMTYDGSTLTAYVDGVSAGTVTFNRQAPYNVGSNGLFYLLAHQDGTNMGDGGFGDYQIGSFEVYTTSLSSSQITSNYNNSSSNYICATPTPTPTLTSTPTNTPTPSSTPSIVSSGLVIQLDAYDSSSYPGTGTTVFDITGGYNHTLIGATYTVLNGIKCFDCTTGNNRVDYNATGPTLPNSGYTYITWARLIPSNTVFRTLLYTNGATKITPITIPNGTNTLGYWDTAFRSSGYDLSGQTSVWVQYAIVGTNSSQKFYINGSEVGSQIAFGSGGNTHWGWGNNDIVAQPWGHVANMYFYNRQLSLSEITQQYNYLAPRFAEITPTPTNTPTSTETPTNTPSETPTNTPTNTETPTNTPTNTPTITETPTNTPTPSVTPEPVTGYSFNLIILPYNFPTTGNTIMNQGAIQTGTTNPNLLTTSGRGIYFNTIDSNGIDRESYFTQFTGQSVTITMTQTGSTAIYSGDTNSFKYWSANTGTPPGVPGDGFVFGTAVGVPPSNTPSGVATLIQSATTNWTVGLPVYVSLVVQ
jgi:hypothetical protein